MKKYISACFGFVFMMICFALPVSAVNNITEMPDVKIVIDGHTGTYEDTPININNRTLLPLKGILVNLGVNDDNEHIAWNSKERSVTVLKDSTKIYLKIGSDKAAVNGEEIVLDASPVIYNSRTYIPVNFIAKSLGMKVVWDASTKSVLIREQAEFDNIKSIIEKSNAAMKKVKSCKAKADISMDAGQEGMNIDMNMDMTIDMLMKKIYMKMNMSIINMNIDFYFADNTMYMKNSLTEEWERTTMSDSEYADIFDSSSNISILDGSDALYAGLKEVESENPDEILLKGDVFLGELLEMASMTQGTDLSDVVFNKFNVEISLDKNTYRMNNIVMDVNYSNLNDEMQAADMSIKCVYTDYDGKVDIVVPEDVINSAVENPALADEI